MPLTAELNLEFPAAYVDEYMAIEIGPTTRKLREKRFVFSDVINLLEAYMRANPPRVERREAVGEVVVEILVWGRSVPNPPDPPWPDREAAQRRNAELLAERESP